MGKLSSEGLPRLLPTVAAPVLMISTLGLVCVLAGLVVIAKKKKKKTEKNEIVLNAFLFIYVSLPIRIQLKT